MIRHGWPAIRPFISKAVWPHSHPACGKEMVSVRLCSRSLLSLFAAVFGLAFRGTFRTPGAKRGDRNV